MKRSCAGRMNRVKSGFEKIAAKTADCLEGEIDRKVDEKVEETVEREVDEEFEERGLRKPESAGR